VRDYRSGAYTIENSILYVSPLYLRAETGQLPDLKRVIAAYGDHAIMEETLAEALAALFKVSAPPPSPFRARQPHVSREPWGPSSTRGLSHYDRAIAWLKAGDWGALAPAR
jgi:uncharacterized membrane protein (UPF0182 family)